MKILLVNDDGYTSKGIVLLAKTLAKNHNVVVVAPHKCNSGMAHAMTFWKDIYLKKIELDEEDCYSCFSVTGTPADCVKLGTELMSSDKPDLIISGINNEPNIGTSVVYSGTANAAMEATILGYKSIALSANPENDEDYNYIVNYFLAHFDYYLSMCNTEYALNININNEKIGNKGHKITPLGVIVYNDIYIVGENDEYGTPHKLVGNPRDIPNPDDCDVTWFSKGYTTITPLTSNNTMFSALSTLKGDV